MSADLPEVNRALMPGADNGVIRLGRWQDALADVESVDALISDPPYSERTHAKQRHGRRDGDEWVASKRQWASSDGLSYAHLSSSDVKEFVELWSPRTRGWFCVFSDSELYPVWRDMLRAAHRYVFAPLPCVQRGMNVRLAGDGPSNWTTWLVVARPIGFMKWGTLPGGYIGNPFDLGESTSSRGAGGRGRVVGAKPLWMMRAIIRDYTRTGDVIVDPCAGGGTTLLAALTEGRRAVGAECLPEHYEIARKRLARGFTPSLFTESSGAPTEQLKLGGDE